MSNSYNDEAVYIKGYRFNPENECWIPLKFSRVENFFETIRDLTHHDDNTPKKLIASYPLTSDFEYRWNPVHKNTLYMTSHEPAKTEMTMEVVLNYNKNSGYLNMDFHTSTRYKGHEEQKEFINISGDAHVVISYMKCFKLLLSIFKDNVFDPRVFENNYLQLIRHVYYFDYLLKAPLEDYFTLPANY